jgi:hypothetical protein
MPPKVQAIQRDNFALAGSLEVEFVPLYPTLFRTIEKLISKLLRDHEAADAAVHDAYADAAELWIQNIGAMAG